MHDVEKICKSWKNNHSICIEYEICTLKSGKKEILISKELAGEIIANLELVCIKNEIFNLSFYRSQKSVNAQIARLAKLKARKEADLKTLNNFLEKLKQAK